MPDGEGTKLSRRGWIGFGFKESTVYNPGDEHPQTTRKMSQPPEKALEEDLEEDVEEDVKPVRGVPTPQKPKPLAPHNPWSEFSRPKKKTPVMTTAKPPTPQETPKETPATPKEPTKETPVRTPAKPPTPQETPKETPATPEEPTKEPTKETLEETPKTLQKSSRKSPRKSRRSKISSKDSSEKGPEEFSNIERIESLEKKMETMEKKMEALEKKLQEKAEATSHEEKEDPTKETVSEPTTKVPEELPVKTIKATTEETPVPGEPPKEIPEQTPTPRKPLEETPHDNGSNTDLNRVKKSLNVDSLPFTPSSPLIAPGKPSTTISQAVNAPPFTPRSMASGTSTPNVQTESQPALNPAQIREFTPGKFDASSNALATDGASDGQAAYDTYSMNGVHQALPSTPYNHYPDGSNAISSNGAAYYPPSASFVAPNQPLQYHLYAPIGPHKEDIQLYQRHAHDFFMPEALREELQKKAEATFQAMPGSQLPTLDHYHSLVALDTNYLKKNATVFGYPSWIYKATSAKNGHMYCLRRIEGYQLTHERAITQAKEWRKVNCGAVVSVIDVFSTRVFGDRSLIFVTNYHPLSKTLVEHHFTNTNRYGNRVSPTPVPEDVLWSYIVQIASALKAVHAADLAIRCMDPSKVIITEKGRIRLNACAILDAVNSETPRSITELQQDDFILLGKLILAIACNDLSALTSPNPKGFVDQLARMYTEELRNTTSWLLTPAPTSEHPRSAGDLMAGIASHAFDAFDSQSHAVDTLYSELAREVENGRLARLLMKLGTINERPEYDGDTQWSEVGDRYPLKLFRDYVFHQVNADNRPHVDMGHILNCLNKLDAGSQEKITLTSRNGNDVIVVSYSELKKRIASAFAELQKPTRR